MKTAFRYRELYGEYVEAMFRMRRGMRRGNLGEVQAWLDIAERCLRAQNRFDASILAEEKRNTLRAEHPHRLKVLEHRARFPRGI